MEILDPTPPDQEWGNGAFCLSRAFILVFFWGGGKGREGGREGGVFFHFILFKSVVSEDRRTLHSFQLLQMHLVFNLKKITKTGRISCLFHSRFVCKLFKVLSWQTEMTDFPTLSYTCASEISTLSYTRSLKKVPLSGGSIPYKPLGTLRSEDGDGRESIAEKVNLRSFNPYRDYSKSLTLSNVGEPS